MNQIDSQLSLCQEWSVFLQKRGHAMLGSKSAGLCISSKDAVGKRYRWVPLAATGATRSIGAEEKDELALQLRYALKRSESCFLVTWFPAPINRVIVLPVSRALKVGRVDSRKGGIPWD